MTEDEKRRNAMTNWWRWLSEREIVDRMGALSQARRRERKRRQALPYEDTPS